MALTKLTKVAKKAEEGYFCQYKIGDVIHEFRITKEEYNGMGKNASVQSRIPARGQYIGGYSKYDYDTPSTNLEDGQYADDKEGFYRVKDPRLPFPFRIEKIAFNGDSIDTSVGKYNESFTKIENEAKSLPR